MSTFGTLLVRRVLTYTDIFLLFFSAISPDSFANVKAEWVGEVKQHKSSCPVCCGYQNRPEN